MGHKTDMHRYAPKRRPRRGAQADSNPAAPTTGSCEYCGKPFLVQRAGQKTCSDECADAEEHAR